MGGGLAAQVQGVEQGATGAAQGLEAVAGAEGDTGGRPGKRRDRRQVA